jgi:hypothetical protein
MHICSSSRRRDISKKKLFASLNMIPISYEIKEDDDVDIAPFFQDSHYPIG